MKKFLFVFVMIFFMIMVSGCFNTPQFEGLKYQITRSELPTAKTIIAKGSDGYTYYTTPVGVNVAFATVFFPTREDFITIFDLTPNASDRHPIANIAPYLDGSIMAISATLDEPCVVSLDNAELTSLDTFQMELYKEYFGAVVQIVYYEFEMADFSVRFYANNSGSYLAKDVLIKRDGDPNWKFAYQCGTVDTSQNPWSYSFSTELFDQRQTTIFRNEFDIQAGNEFLMHLYFTAPEDYADGGGSFESKPILLAYGMSSSSQISECGGGFGRIDEDVIGITFTVSYSFSDEHMCGLQHNFPVAQGGSMHWTDLVSENDTGRKIYPINSVEYGVIYTNKGDSTEE